MRNRCVSLKTSVDQLKERLQNAAIVETELKAELNCMQKERTEHSHTLTGTQEKLKHMQKTLSNSENERRLLADRLESTQTALNEVHHNQQSQQDVIQRLQTQIADLEVQKSTLEAQLRITKWNAGPCDSEKCAHNSGDVSSQLLKAQREKNELRLKIETLNEKLRQMECEKLSKFSESRHYDGSDKMHSSSDYSYDSNKLLDAAQSGCKDAQHYVMKQENHELKLKICRLETQMAEKESELVRLRAKLIESTKCSFDDIGKHRAAHMKTERLSDIREQSYRQQIDQLENQVRWLIEYIIS